MAEEKIELSAPVKELLDEVDALYPLGMVHVDFTGDKSGFVRHDQANLKQVPGMMVVQVSDLTEPNYTASHELLHLYYTLKQYPQVLFNLTWGDEDLDDQSRMFATGLYDAVMHRLIVAEQRKRGLINDQIEQEYLMGLKDALPKEDADPLASADQKMNTLVRVINLFDALIFYREHLAAVEKELVANYPYALSVAKEWQAKLFNRPMETPWETRRTIVNLFKLVDEQMRSWGLPVLNNQRYTTVTPVLSERQLRLEVKQVFEIYRSDMQLKGNQGDAYAGLRRGDGQNSFVIPMPEKNSPAEFVKLYAEPVQEFLEKRGFPYTVREG